MKRPILEQVTIKFFYNEFSDDKTIEKEIKEVEEFLINTGIKHDIYNIDNGEIMVDLYNLEPEEVSTTLAELKVR